MVSIRRFLSTNTTAKQLEDQARCLSVILEGVCVHAFRSCPDDYAMFCADVRSLTERLAEPNPDPGSMLITAGAINQRLEVYRRAVERDVRTWRAELQMMIGMLADTLVRAARANERTVSSLIQVERELDKALAAEDVRNVRGHLEECLRTLQAGITFQSAEAKVVQSALASSVSLRERGVDGRIGAAEDALTGLPGMAGAMAAVEAIMASPAACYLIAIQLTNLPVIAQRYGSDVGDQYCMSVAQLLACALQPEDRLFLLNKSTFAVLLRREERLDSVRREMERISGSCRGYQVSIGSRNAMIRMSVKTSLYPVWEWSDSGDLLERACTGEVHSAVGH